MSVTKKVNYNNEDYDIGADAKNIYLDVEKDTKENRYSLQAKISDINKSIRLGPDSGNANGEYSTAFGFKTAATGFGAHAEGAYAAPYGGPNILTTAAGEVSHAEGRGTRALDEAAHVEGYLTQAGFSTKDNPVELYTFKNVNPTGAAGAHAEGFMTIATNQAAHAEGIKTQATSFAAHAEGEETIASARDAHAEGFQTQASAQCTHAEGYNTLAEGYYSHAEGNYTRAKGINSHAEGSPYYNDDGSFYVKTIDINQNSYHLYSSWAEGEGSHAEGIQTFALGKGSHAEGIQTEARGEASHAEGYTTIAEGSGSHVEGKNNQGQGPAIHIEGQENIVKVNSTAVHIEGYGHVADLQPYEISFARTYSLSSLGVRNTISLNQSKIFFDEPYNYQLSEVFLDVESDYLLLQGEVFGSHGLNIQKVAYETSSNSLFFQSPPDIQAYLNNFSVSKALIKPVGDLLTKGAHVQGCWSKIDNYAHIVGNGISNTNRRNIHTIDWDGNAEFAGDVIAYGCEGENPISLKALAEKEYIGQKTKQEGEIFNDYIGNIANYHAHAEGHQTKSQGNYSHAEGLFTYALGQCAHVEGESNMATGLDSHAEGCDLVAFGPYSHAEGGSNGMSFIIQLTGDVNTERYIVSKTEETKHLLKGGIIKFVDNSLEPPMNRNYATIVQFDNATQELVLDRTLSENRSLQNTTVYCYCCGAFSKSSHAEGIGTVATGRSQHVQGEYNIIDSKNTIGTGNRGTYAHIVGNGTGANNRSNAHTLDWSGNAMFAGDIQFKYNDGIQSLSAILKNLQSQIDALKK